MIKIENLTKTFRTTEVETLAQRICSNYGTFRLWKVYLIKYYGAVG